MRRKTRGLPFQVMELYRNKRFVGVLGCILDTGNKGFIGVLDCILDTGIRRCFSFFV